MKFIKKAFKKIKKGIKKVGKVFSKALDKLGISKILGKMGPLGSMALMFAMPYLGAWWSGLGAASPATSFIGQAAQTLHKMASTVGNVVLSPVKAMIRGLNAFGPTKDLVTNATNLFKDAHNFVADKLGIKQAFGPPKMVTGPGGIPMGEDTASLFEDIKQFDTQYPNLKDSPLVSTKGALNDIVASGYKGPATDNFLLNQRNTLSSTSVLEDSFYKDPKNLFGVDSTGNIPVSTDIKDMVDFKKMTAPDAPKSLLDSNAGKGVFERKLGKFASKDIDWSDVTFDDARQFFENAPSLTPNDLMSTITDKENPLGNMFGNTRIGTIYQANNVISGMLRDETIDYRPGTNLYAAGLASAELSKIDVNPISTFGTNTSWADDIQSIQSTNLSSGSYGFHPNNVNTYDLYGQSYDLEKYLNPVSRYTEEYVPAYMKGADSSL